jgi:DNA-binding LacI/PurR family transcriptional regulator
MEFARHFRVPLTTVHQPFRSIGETAVHLVCEHIETGRTAPKRVTLPTSIIVRRSCGAPVGVTARTEGR